MTRTRHGLLIITLTLTALAATATVTGAGGAQALGTSVFPTKPITLIVPAAPGSTTDIAARMPGVSVAAVSGQAVVVDNRGGANGVSAAVVVKRAEPDGHTLMMQYSGYHVIPPSVSKQARQREAKDLQPVANVLSAPQVTVVRAGPPRKQKNSALVRPSRVFLI